MPKTRDQKQVVIDELKDRFARAKSVVFAQVQSGYSMDDANALRTMATKEGLEAGITKKTLLQIAAKDIGIELSSEDLPGSTLTIFGYDDEVAPSRAMMAFLKGREGMSVTSAVISGEVVGADTVKAYAALPSREELLAKLVGSINAPVSGFVNVLAGNLRGLAQVLNAIKEQKA